MSRSIITLGMDVHKDSITLAVLPDGAPAPTRLDRLPNDLAKLRRYCDRLAEQGELSACYEASGASYVLHRAMREWGYACDVIAPSLIPTKPGVQRKHDKHDAARPVGCSRLLCGAHLHVRHDETVSFDLPGRSHFDALSPGRKFSITQISAPR